MTTRSHEPDREGSDAEREGMREGDDRPFVSDDRVPLTFLPRKGEPFRWLPRHGGPFCVGEWIVQHLIRAIAYLPVYIAIVVTIILLIQIKGVPW